MIEHQQPRQGKPPLRPVPPSFGKLHELDPVAVGVRKIAGDTPRRDHRRRVDDPGAVLRQPPVDGLDIIHLDGQVRRADRAALIARPLSGGGVQVLDQLQDVPLPDVQNRQLEMRPS